MEGSSNTTFLFFTWWYGEAFARVFRYIRAAYIYTTDSFSVGICLRTLFAPWKRDVISYSGLTLQQRFSVWTLNLASRFIGALIKLATLITFLIFAILLSIFSVLAVVLWFLYPAVIIYLIWRGFSILKS